MTTKVFLITGLTFNTIGAIVLLLPNLNPWKHIFDEEIIVADDNNTKYIQGKDIKNMIYSLIGFLFLFVGFILQLIATAAT